MNRVFLSCSVCGVTAEIEGYDPAPTELLVNAFSEAHKHTEEERASYRKSEAESFKSYYEGDDDDRE